MPSTLGLNDHWEHRRKLAIMCRIVANWGYIGTFGHLSIRVPDTDLVLITPGAGSEKSRCRADQIFIYGLDGQLLHHPGGELVISEPAEWPIHTRIHRDKPHVLSVAHLHSPHTMLLGICDKPIEPIFNQAFYLKQGIPTWDNPMLVLNDAEAAPLSETLADKVACQMRGHGSVVVGRTPEECLMNVYTVEEAAKFQIMASSMGGHVPFSDETIAECALQRANMGKTHSVPIWTVIWAYFERRVLMDGVPL